MHYGNRVVEVVKFELVCAGLRAERAFVSGVGRDATGTIERRGCLILWLSYGHLMVVYLFRRRPVSPLSVTPPRFGVKGER